MPGRLGRQRHGGGVWAGGGAPGSLAGTHLAGRAGEVGGGRGVETILFLVVPGFAAAGQFAVLAAGGAAAGAVIAAGVIPARRRVTDPVTETVCPASRSSQ